MQGKSRFPMDKSPASSHFPMDKAGLLSHFPMDSSAFWAICRLLETIYLYQLNKVDTKNNL